jgi:hypothetical protein
MNGGDGVGGLPAKGGGAGVVGPPEGVAQVHGTSCQGFSLPTRTKRTLLVLVRLLGTKGGFCLSSLVPVGL